MILATHGVLASTVHASPGLMLDGHDTNLVAAYSYHQRMLTDHTGDLIEANTLFSDTTDTIPFDSTTNLMDFDVVEAFTDTEVTECSAFVSQVAGTANVTSSTVGNRPTVLNCGEVDFTFADFLSCSDNTALSMGSGVSFTLMVHCKPNIRGITNGARRALISKGGPLAETEWYLGILGTGTNAATFELRVNDGTTTTQLLHSTVTNAEWVTVWAWLDISGAVLGMAVDDGTGTTSAYASYARDSTYDFLVGSAGNTLPAVSYRFVGVISHIAVWKRYIDHAERSSIVVKLDTPINARVFRTNDYAGNAANTITALEASAETDIYLIQDYPGTINFAISPTISGKKVRTRAHPDNSAYFGDMTFGSGTWNGTLELCAESTFASPTLATAAGAIGGTLVLDIRGQRSSPEIQWGNIDLRVYNTGGIYDVRCIPATTNFYDTAATDVHLEAIPAATGTQGSDGSSGDGTPGNDGADGAPPSGGDMGGSGTSGGTGNDGGTGSNGTAPGGNVNLYNTQITSLYAHGAYGGTGGTGGIGGSASGGNGGNGGNAQDDGFGTPYDGGQGGDGGMGGMGGNGGNGGPGGNGSNNVGTINVDSNSSIQNLYRLAQWGSGGSGGSGGSASGGAGGGGGNGINGGNSGFGGASGSDGSFGNSGEQGSDGSAGSAATLNNNGTVTFDDGL